MAEIDVPEISKYIKFSDLVKWLEQIESASVPKKTEILKKYITSFNNYRNEFLKQHGPNANRSFFPVLRLLLPNADRQRLAYGIKGKTLGKLYVKMLGINPEGEDAKEIISDKATSSRNYADICYRFLRNRCRLSGNLTVFDVNKHLDNIAEHNQNNNRNKIEEELLLLMREMTALDQKWLIRIILKELSLKLTEKKILAIYHPNANKFHSQFSHLSKVCECVEANVAVDVDAIPTLIPFQPVQPMLSQRISLKALAPLLSEKQFYVETKMDGERFTLHINNGEYRYFSRKCHDFTRTYGADITQGSLTPYLHNLFKIKIQNAIFDGEMMVWDKNAAVYCVKGENYDVKNIKENDPIVRPCYCIFDVLYFNDKDLLSIPYAERIRLLGTIFDDKVGILQKCHPIKLRDSSHLLQIFNKAIDAKEEGVIIKVEDSQYHPNERNGGWFKIKPDYIDGFITDFDLLIVGGFYNNSRTYINVYVLGVLSKNEGDDQPNFYATAKVEHGLSIEKRKELGAFLKPLWKTFDSIQLTKTKTRIENPPNIDFGDIRPDVWIEPKDSVILETKASELVQNKSFRTNFELRFPRIIAIRSDKLWLDCCTLEEFQQLCNNDTKVSKLTKRHLTMADLEAGESSKKISPKKFCPASTITQPYSISEIKIIDNVCANLDICVLSSDVGKPSIEELETLVRKHNGRVVKNPGPNTFAVIVGKRTITAKKFIETQLYNVTTVDWLLRALSGEEPKTKLLEFHPFDMLSVNRSLKNDFLLLYDEFGDSYTKQISEDELKNTLDHIDNSALPSLIRRQLFDIEMEVLGSKQIYNIFRLLTGYFHYNEIDCNADLKLAQLLFKSRGGVVVADASFASHVFIDPSQFDNAQYALPNCTEYQQKIVCYKYILDSIALGKETDINPYIHKYTEDNKMQI